MTEKKTRVLSQIRMPEWLFEAWESFAVQTKQDQKAVIEHFIGVFIKEKTEFLRRAEIAEVPTYLVLYDHPPGSQVRSVWLSCEVDAKVRTFAQHSGHRANRIIFSALLAGLVSHEKIVI